MALIPVKSALLEEIFSIAASDKIKNFCQQNHISSLKLFGSILTENFKESSDIDILIDFHPEHIPGFFRFMEIQSKLSELFDNRKIDLRTRNDLSRYFRQDILNEAVEIYD
ncbi:MAG: nucleotidyltransferase family protein [Promethearchaeota archaeon]